MIETPLPCPRPLWRIRVTTRSPGASMNSSGSTARSIHAPRNCSNDSISSAALRRCCGTSGIVRSSRHRHSSWGSRSSASVSLDISPRLKALKASSALRTISTFSSDIAHAVSPDGVPLSMQSAALLVSRNGNFTRRAGPFAYVQMLPPSEVKTGSGGLGEVAERLQHDLVMRLRGGLRDHVGDHALGIDEEG